MFIYFEGGGAVRRGERERILSRLHAERKAQCGAPSHEVWDHDLSQNQESDAQQTEPTGAPKLKKKKKNLEILIEMALKDVVDHKKK